MTSTRRSAARRFLVAASLAAAAATAGFATTSEASTCDAPVELRVMTAHGPTTFTPPADPTCG